ncbi:hypothetical protein F5X71_08380 [Nocardia brasiliensis]|uniref:Uncharacterized protein n=1 Tax=Nocardia brasiliensis TaxID=37326 RepID=A0A6G9XN41_NOCBR|nr:hypothetical protein [Nocardia brasiliensis]QIS02337.1 hypothetical protein F5X71_08380 [Nocardia brasiliensis]
MPENQNAPILPVPSELYRDMRELGDHIEALRDELASMRARYRELGACPESLAVDALGEPIEPSEANERILGGLKLTDSELQAAAEWLDTTRTRYASRLKLTDAADAERERRLTQARRSPRFRQF